MTTEPQTPTQAEIDAAKDEELQAAVDAALAEEEEIKRRIAHYEQRRQDLLTKAEADAVDYRRAKERFGELARAFADDENVGDEMAACRAEITRLARSQLNRIEAADALVPQIQDLEATLPPARARVQLAKYEITLEARRRAIRRANEAGKAWMAAINAMDLAVSRAANSAPPGRTAFGATHHAPIRAAIEAWCRGPAGSLKLPEIPE